MLDSIFLTVNQWMTGGIMIAAAGSFLWGMISVLFSPCHLASIPLIVGYVGGQETMVQPRQASVYSVIFTLGLFLTIALIGLICALLGRMLGDIGNYWQILIGAILVWVSLGMLGVEKCSISGGPLHRIKMKGMAGAFFLGLAYGVLSGSCTFGFIAPILALITIQEKIMTGVILIVLFGMGHCLPIAIAGSSTALVKKLLESHARSGAVMWFRKLAGTTIMLMGLYFIAAPFIPALQEF